MSRSFDIPRAHARRVTKIFRTPLRACLKVRAARNTQTALIVLTAPRLFTMGFPIERRIRVETGDSEGSIR